MILSFEHFLEQDRLKPMRSLLNALLIFSCATLTAACAAKPKKLPQDAAYWQRKEASSQIYLTGPKAQHTLNRDIANCTVEIRELQRLGSLRQATPPNTRRPRSDGAPRGGYVAGYDTPEYDKNVYAAYFEYSDFEGCMREKGWQRVNYVAPEVADDSERNFLRSVFGVNEKIKRDHYGTFPNDYEKDPNYTGLNQ